MRWSEVERAEEGDGLFEPGKGRVGCPEVRDWDSDDGRFSRGERWECDGGLPGEGERHRHRVMAEEGCLRGSGGNEGDGRMKARGEGEKEESD